VEVTGLQGGYRLGAGLRLVTGQAAGRQLYCMSTVGDVFFCDGRRDANLLRFSDVLPGDEVHVDNHRFLAYCYYARHHVLDVEHFDFFKVDGRAIYPQHEVPAMAPTMGVPFSGQYAGKLLYTHNTHDGMVVPPQGMLYPRAILAAQGPEGLAERFRMRWTENAEHGGLFIVPDAPGRAASTRLIEYQPITEQSLADLAAWVEDGVPPEGTNFDYHGARVFLPATAAQRGGIQPVVSVTANGGSRAEVLVGEPVTLEMQAEVPPKAGTIISVTWDFDGTGTYPFTHDVDGSATKVNFATTHTYDRPGSYFATALVESHRHGDIKSAACRIPNLASARVVVA
jgi:PKD domain